jgi:DNA uptake protein ComE-like DNA-binding protein
MRGEAREQLQAEVGSEPKAAPAPNPAEVEKRVEAETRRIEAEAERLAIEAAAKAHKDAEEQLTKLRDERDDALKKLREAEKRLEAAPAEKPAAPKPQPKPAEKAKPAAKKAASPKPATAKAKPEPEPEEELELTGPVALNEATFEELRALGFSAAQANRVIAYRDRLGGYKALDDLETVPGVQREFLTKLKDRLQV